MHHIRDEAEKDSQHEHFKFSIVASAINNDGAINNNGTISNTHTGTINNNSDGTITNNNKIINRCGGTINNLGTITGNPITNIACP